jgi:hypothetical protein
VTLKLIPSICVVEPEQCRANVVSALARNLPVCNRAPRRSGMLAIVGSAPSVNQHIEELRAWPGEIWAINGAYDYLLERGVVANGFLGMDPVPGLADYVTKAKPETTFFISSVCDPSLFDALKARDVWIWHTKWDEMPYPPDAKVVSGGTTCMTRAPFLANMLGWRSMTIYGADSSFQKGRYAYTHGRYATDSTAAKMIVECDGQLFETELAMLKQVAQLGAVKDVLGSQINFRCGGLMEAYLRAPLHDIEEFAAA